MLALTTVGLVAHDDEEGDARNEAVQGDAERGEAACLGSTLQPHHLLVRPGTAAVRAVRHDVQRPQRGTHEEQVDAVAGQQTAALHEGVGEVEEAGPHSSVGDHEGSCVLAHGGSS